MVINSPSLQALQRLIILGEGTEKVSLFCVVQNAILVILLLGSCQVLNVLTSRCIWRQFISVEEQNDQCLSLNYVQCSCWTKTLRPCSVSVFFSRIRVWFFSWSNWSTDMTFKSVINSVKPDKSLKFYHRVGRVLFERRWYDVDGREIYLFLSFFLEQNHFRK